jgi:hypothetical protein
MLTVKNLAVFYAAIFLPLISVVLMSRTRFIDSMMLVILFFVYAFIYRPLISGYRLILLGAIKKSDLFRNFIPFWNIRYYNLLFFNRT